MERVEHGKTVTCQLFAAGLLTLPAGHLGRRDDGTAIAILQ